MSRFCSFLSMFWCSRSLSKYYVNCGPLKYNCCGVVNFKLNLLIIHKAGSALSYVQYITPALVEKKKLGD